MDYDSTPCQRCGQNEADTDQQLHTSKYQHVCAKCYDDDHSIQELDNDIAELYDVLELSVGDYGAALELKNKQDELNKLFESW